MSQTRGQVARSNVSGFEPTDLLEGSLFINSADLVFGMQGPAALIKPIAVKQFAETASYEANDLVSYLGAIYSSQGAVTPGPFDPADWSQVSQSPFGGILASVGWNFAITYNTDDLVSEVLYSRGTLRVRYTFSYTADSLVDTLLVESSVDSGTNWSTEGTVTMSYANELTTGGTW